MSKYYRVVFEEYDSQPALFGRVGYDQAINDYFSHVL